MRSLNELKTFLSDKSGVSIIKHETGLLEFEVNHKTGLGRKALMNELYQYSGYKIKSMGKNTEVKQYIIYK
ncbi:MAG: hypothetical protein ACOCV8_01370 [Spirochaetota bacterium]